jgi:two-component system response regulator PhoP
VRALVIEDDPALRAQVAQYFADEGFVVDTAGDGEQGLYKATEYPVDLAIVDLGLPKISGVDIIKQARKKGCAYPILILTARDGWESKVAGLEAGADDYVVKPFHKEELMARARALLRRSGGWAHSMLESGPIVLDTAAKSVTLGGAAVELTAYEYRLLEYLLLHAGRVVSKSTLTEHLYAEDMERDSNVIEVFVRRLRAKLDPDEQLRPIETLRGQGYRWTLPRKEKEGTRG